MVAVWIVLGILLLLVLAAWMDHRAGRGWFRVRGGAKGMRKVRDERRDNRARRRANYLDKDTSWTERSKRNRGPR